MSSQIANIHDAFFKRVLGDQEAADRFLREHLPPEVIKLITSDPPEPVRRSPRGPAAPPAFRHALVDLACVADDRLSAEPRLRAHLKALKYARRPDLAEKVDVVLAEAPVLEVLDVALILTYIDRGPVTVSSDAIREVLRRLVPGREEEIMGHLTQPYFMKGLAEGRIEGLAEGRTEGRAEGEAIALLRLLEKRFGVLPAAVRQRVFTADLGSIEAWFERAIDGPDLESVFKSP